MVMVSYNVWSRSVICVVMVTYYIWLVMVMDVIICGHCHGKGIMCSHGHSQSLCVVIISYNVLPMVMVMWKLTLDGIG